MMACLTAFAAACILAGCSAGAALALKSDGSGSAEADLRVHKALGAYIRDILAFSGETAENTPLFDLANMKSGIETQKGLTLADARIPDTNGLKAKVLFTDINAVFPEGISLKKDKGNTICTILITRNNYRRILERYFELAALQNQKDYLWGLLEPSPEITLTDMYEYAFGEYLDPGETIKAILRQSSITLTMSFPGTILSQTGGIQKGSNTVVYAIPLVDILTLEKPVLLTAVYR